MHILIVCFVEMCRVDCDDRIAHVFHFGKFPSSDPEEKQ